MSDSTKISVGLKRAILQSTPTIVPCTTVGDELAAMDRLLKEAGACLQCGEILVAHESKYLGAPFRAKIISLRCPKCRPVAPSPADQLRAAAVDARYALAKIADQAEADDDIQLAHYCRHRVDALDQALDKVAESEPQP